MHTISLIGFHLFRLLYTIHNSTLDKKLIHNLIFKISSSLEASIEIQLF